MLIILVLVWCKSIHFRRRYARKTIYTFSHWPWPWPLTFRPQICSL